MNPTTVNKKNRKIFLYRHKKSKKIIFFVIFTNNEKFEFWLIKASTAQRLEPNTENCKGVIMKGEGVIDFKPFFQLTVFPL